MKAIMVFSFSSTFWKIVCKPCDIDDAKKVDFFVETQSKVLGWDRNHTMPTLTPTPTAPTAMFPSKE